MGNTAATRPILARFPRPHPQTNQMYSPRNKVSPSTDRQTFRVDTESILSPSFSLLRFPFHPPSSIIPPPFFSNSRQSQLTRVHASKLVRYRYIPLAHLANFFVPGTKDISLQGFFESLNFSWHRKSIAFCRREIQKRFNRV